MGRKPHKRGQSFSAEEILHGVRMMRAKHGEPLTFHRFCRNSGVPGWQVYKHFRSWYEVREAAGLPRKIECSRKIPDETLLEAFHKVVRTLRRYPTPAEFERLGGIGYHLLWRRIGTWEDVKLRYRDWLDDRQRQREIERQVAAELPQVFNPQPVSEPKRDVAWIRDSWLGLRVGFELESRHFEGRNPCDCDLLVVLLHNWQQCPVPVLELVTVMPQLEERR